MPAITSLLRSAEAARKKVQAQQDAEIAYGFSNSAKTYEDYVRYSDYLQKRAKSVSDPSTALSLQKTMDSAYKGYVSNEIQRQSINVIEGRGSSVQKYNTILGFMNQAMTNGNYDLAQGLNMQLDNLYVTIQNEAKSAQVAAEKLANAEGASNANMAQSLKNGLDNLTAAYNRGGQLAYNKAAQQFVDANRDKLKAMGVDVPKGTSTNVGQLVSGVVKAIGTYYALASQATALSDPGRSQDYLSKAQDIASGSTQFNTPAGKLDYYQMQDMAQNPRLYVESQDNYGNTILKRSTVGGFQVDTSGNVQAVPTGSTQNTMNPKDSKQYQKQLEQLGFGNIRQNKDGSYTVQLTDKSSKWLDPTNLGKTSNAEINLYKTDQGYQFFDKGNNKLYNLAVDEKGLGGLYTLDNLNQQTHLGGQYGFNQNTNSLIRQASFLQTKKQLDAFTQAMVTASAVRNQPGSAARIAPAAEQQSANYLRSQGVKSFSLQNSGLTPQNQVYQAALALQPFYKATSTINGRAYNYAGEFIPNFQKRNDGGFNFTDANGKAISALTYAQQTHSDFGKLLQYMSSQGDKYAGQFATNPNAAGRALTWK